MISKELNDYLHGIITVDLFKNGIRSEVVNYKNLLEKKGSTINLYYDDVETIYLKNNDVVKLLEETLGGKLTNIELTYICECLTLAQNIEFENEQVHESIFEIADPEINGGFKTETELKIMLANLNEQRNCL
ncbi:MULTISPECIES: hypothetical protein [unclassified Kaistella]|uniref:hypothetical protein n=1 Tax=unclassified Kaistella TaxID=2762626 RepID=UPI0027356BF1|nr:MULTISPECIES: hypothetical protein [unclassified Kaistella]MDP2455366.1 hypothetical protein [Kaistella sp. SH11-4b]MDP2458275.1 hypothetical protein [Kaistella sp. SH40-3]MDP2461184.1 hypothetical protein [Kaistella sp. SH19-2b]